MGSLNSQPDCDLKGKCINKMCGNSDILVFKGTRDHNFKYGQIITFRADIPLDSNQKSTQNSICQNHHAIVCGKEKVYTRVCYFDKLIEYKMTQADIDSCQAKRFLSFEADNSGSCYAVKALEEQNKVEMISYIKNDSCSCIDTISEWTKIPKDKF